MTGFTLQTEHCSWSSCKRNPGQMGIDKHFESKRVLDFCDRLLMVAKRCLLTVAEEK